METRANYVLLGGVAIIGVILIMLFAMWLARSEWSREYATYDVVFEGAVRGLANGGEVRFNGIKVGEVEELRIDPDNANRVIARIRVTSTTPVKADTQGQLEQIGLTGVTLIQLSAGSADLPVLRQGLGQPPPRIVGLPDPINEIIGAGEDIATRVLEALASAQALLTTENIENVSATLRDIRLVTEELAAQRAAIGQAGEAIVAMRDGGRAFADLSRDAQGRLEGLDANATALLQETQTAAVALTAAVKDTRELLAELEAAAAVANAQTLPEITLAAQDLRRTAVALERLAVEVEADPYGFVFDRSRPTVAVAP